MIDAGLAPAPALGRDGARRAVGGAQGSSHAASSSGQLVLGRRLRPHSRWRRSGWRAGPEAAWKQVVEPWKLEVVDRVGHGLSAFCFLVSCATLPGFAQKSMPPAHSCQQQKSPPLLPQTPECILEIQNTND